MFIFSCTTTSSRLNNRGKPGQLKQTTGETLTKRLLSSSYPTLMLLKDLLEVKEF